MYERLCGEEDAMPWFGEAYCAMANLVNINVKPPLYVSKSHADRLLNFSNIGKENMDRAGVRFIPALRTRASKEMLAQANAQKINKLEHFSDSFK